ncbi:MAG: [Firmicutes bacterium]|nr:[FeFe] hydrogenase H-cluster radical SAM maturase HydE [Bacillota bacterium]
MKDIVKLLRNEGTLDDEGMKTLLRTEDEAVLAALYGAARETREAVYGKKVYIRGLIEISSHCKNNCYYCGLRCENHHAERYRLDDDTILHCCAVGYDAGFRTFVLQGGEDRYFSDERLTHLIGIIKERYPDTAVTLSLGERSRESYQRLFDAGADRYLLRHETANAAHYGKLHPENLSFARRMECLRDLKDIGYQVGCGMMVGSPHQTEEYLLEDLRFLREFRPEMVGIGPFLPHKDTPFGKEIPGSTDRTLRLLAIIRLMLPHVLLPATTALATAEEDGRERGILAGANVVMPNLSPADVRTKYMLYDNKRSFGSEAAECLDQLRASMAKIGYEVVTDRGDYIKETDGKTF